MNNEMKKKLDERLVSGEITTEEYQKILKTIESSATELAEESDEPEQPTTTSVPPKTDTSVLNTSQEKGFLKKLRDGDYGLAKTYWLYGIIVSVVVGFLIRMIFMAMKKDGILLAFIIVLIGIIYTALFQLPGLWRAARRYQGPKIWAILGQIIVVITALGIPFVLVQWSRLLEMAGIL